LVTFFGFAFVMVHYGDAGHKILEIEVCWSVINMDLQTRQKRKLNVWKIQKIKRLKLSHPLITILLLPILLLRLLPILPLLQ
jgi:hypothetical protein